MICSLGRVIIIKNAHFFPRKWEERDFENVAGEVNSVAISINTAAFTLLITAELCLQTAKSVSLGDDPAVLPEQRPPSTSEGSPLCAQHSPPETSHLRARILIITCRRVMRGWRVQVSGCMPAIDLPSRPTSDLKPVTVGCVLLNQLWQSCNSRLMRNLHFSGHSC